MNATQIDLPFNIRPLHTNGHQRQFLLDNQTKTDLDITNFLLVPVGLVNKQPRISTGCKIKKYQPDDGLFTRLTIDLLQFQNAEFVVILVELENAYRLNMQDGLPVGARIDEKDVTAVEAFLPTTHWRHYAIPVASGFNDYALVFSSCQYPGDLFRRETPKATLVRAKETLERNTYNNAAPYLLIAGDGVYVDPTAGLFEPKSQNEIFSVAYEAQARSDEWQALLIKMHGTYFAIDDHELIDNWEPSANTEVSKELKDRLALGREWFLRRRYGEADTGQVLWGEYKLGEIPLFVMDTRTERSLRTPENHRTATMISDTQMSALKQWLMSIENKPDFRSVPKVILSPAMILPRTLRTAELTHDVSDLNSSNESEKTIVAMASDSWDGYPQTTGELLGFIAEHRIHNVIFLSGDEHISCIAKAELSTDSNQAPITVHSIHASPLYGPYPFANAKPADFAESETFCQPYLDAHGCANRVNVQVESDTSLTGDAFGLLHITKPRHDQWNVSITLSVANTEEKTINLSADNGWQQIKSDKKV